MTTGLSVTSHQTVHQSDVHQSNGTGDIQSILSRMRPEQSGQSQNAGYSINSGRSQTQGQLHLPMGTGSTVVSQSLQLPMNDHT